MYLIVTQVNVQKSILNSYKFSLGTKNLHNWWIYMMLLGQMLYYCHFFLFVMSLQSIQWILIFSKSFILHILKIWDSKEAATSWALNLSQIVLRKNKEDFSSLRDGTVGTVLPLHTPNWFPLHTNPGFISKKRCRCFYILGYPWKYLKNIWKSENEAICNHKNNSRRFEALESKWNNYIIVREIKIYWTRSHMLKMSFIFLYFYEITLKAHGKNGRVL